MLKRFSSTASRFGSVKQSGSHLEIILKSPRKYINPTSYQTPSAQGVLFNKPNRKQGLAASLVTSGPGQPVTSQLAMEQNTDGIHRSRPEDSLPLQFKLGAVVSDRFGVLIDSLPAGAFSSPDPSNEDGGLVLGFNAGQGEESLVDIRIGQLNVQRMLVCARCKLWWMTPEWRTSTLKLPPETQFLLAELAPTTSTRLEGQDHEIIVLNNTSSKRGQSAGAHYALLLPLIDGDFRCTLRAGSGQGCREGDITLRVESGDKRVKSKSWSKILYVAAGSDPFQLIERGVTAAARLSGGALPLTQKKLPPSLDVFGWCTWDAFYSTVSAQGIQEGLRSLNKGGIRPRTLIIDDGWQTTDVGPEYRQTPTSELAEALHLRAQEQNLLRSTEQDFYNESLEVLAETAVQLSPGTSSGNLMPGLSNLGTEGVRQPHHQPSTDVTNTINMQGSGAESGTTSAVAEQAASGQQQEAGLRAVTIARAVQKMAGFFVGLGTAAYLLIYQWVVEPAAPGSWVVKGFTKLASGPFRPLLLDFFANASDFTRRLTSVRANGKFSHPDAGPGDEWKSQEERLGTVVAHMKQRFSLDYIYCWHGLPAYWAGVMPGAPDLEPLSATIMYAEPTPGVLEVEPSMGWNPAVLAGVGVLPDPGSLYNKMHSYLRSSGVDGVKVDCQAGVGLVGSALGGGAALSHRFHQALEASVLKHFPDNHCINCMCHSTENLYRMLKTSVARASDDFYPRDPASSLPHLAACAFNGLFMSVLVQPDWDMFHSKHVSARLHAMARAISGGGVYVSDKPGEHDFELLRCLVLPDGSVLRALQPCRPTRDVLFNDVLRDNVSLMKLWNVNPYCGVVGIFHLQGSSWDRTRRKFFEHDKGPRPLTGQVRPRDIETFTRKHDAVRANSVVGKQQEGVDLHPSAVKYAAYTMTGKELYVLGHDQPLNITLPSATGELVIVSPILHVTEQGVSFAPLGLCDMFNGGGAVRSCNLQPRAGISDTSGGVSRSTASVNSAVMPAVHPSALCFEVQVHGSGRFLAYCNVAPSGVTVEGLELFFTYDPTSGAVYLEVPATKDLNNTLHFMF